VGLHCARIGQFAFLFAALWMIIAAMKTKLLYWFCIPAAVLLLLGMIAFLIVVEIARHNVVASDLWKDVAPNGRAILGRPLLACFKRPDFPNTTAGIDVERYPNGGFTISLRFEIIDERGENVGSSGRCIFDWNENLSIMPFLGYR
jgi:hypothetical protein